MKRFLLTLCALFLLLANAPATRANDASFEGIGGSLRPTRGENKAIRMTRETVILTAGAETYATRADFVFRNDTAHTQTVQMGFPEGYFEDAASAKSRFIGFRTSVDNQKVTARRTISKTWDSDGFNTYWIKTVSFKPRQTRRVRVEFAAPYSSSNNWGFLRALAYAFTGGNWRGEVRESTLEVRLTQPGVWRAVAVGDDQKTLPLARSRCAGGAVFRHVWKNWQAQQTVTIGLERVQPGWKLDSGGPDNGDFTLKCVAASQSVRVGAKPTAPEKSDGFPPMGLMRNTVFFVEAAHLSDRLEFWGDAQKPPILSDYKRGAQNSFTIISGKTRIEGRVGQSSARVNGKIIALGASILRVPHGDSDLIFVPLAPIAKSLGLKFSLAGERLFRLERGNWRG